MEIDNFLVETVKAALIFPRLGVPSCSSNSLARLQSRRGVENKYINIKFCDYFGSRGPNT